MTYEEFKTEFGVMGIGWSEDEKGDSCRDIDSHMCYTQRH